MRASSFRERCRRLWIDLLRMEAEEVLGSCYLRLCARVHPTNGMTSGASTGGGLHMKTYFLPVASATSITFTPSAHPVRIGGEDLGFLVVVAHGEVHVFAAMRFGCREDRVEGARSRCPAAVRIGSTGRSLVLEYTAHSNESRRELRAQDAREESGAPELPFGAAVRSVPLEDLEVRAERAPSLGPLGPCLRSPGHRSCENSFLVVSRNEFASCLRVQGSRIH